MNKAIILTLLAFISFSATGQRGIVKGQVIDHNGESVIGASVFSSSTQSGTITDLDGNYSINLPAGTQTLTFSYVGFATNILTVSVESGKTTELDTQLKEDAIGLSEIVVLGSRGNDRLVINSPVPVDVISGRELQMAGVTQTIQILQMLVPSYNVSKPSITDGSDHFRPATLRGLGPDQVLVLINGKRRHTNSLVHVNGTVGRGSTGVDLNAIPATAIERVEVLRDGASAQYGSDAIAGVINIILKKDKTLDASVTFGSNFSNFERGYDATEGLQQGITNQNIKDWNNLVNYDWLTSTESIRKTDGQKINAHLGKGFSIGDGIVYLSAQYRNQGRTNRAGVDNRLNYFSNGDGTLNTKEANFDRENNWRYGDSDFREFSLFANGDKALGQNTLYFFAGYNNRYGESGCFFRRANDDRNVRSIYPDGFLPRIAPTITDLSASVGLRGNLGENWNYDLSQVVGKNNFELNMKNTINTSLGGINQFSFPNGIQQKQEIYDGTLGFLQAVTNFDVSRKVDVGFAKLLNIVMGAELRFENYTIQQGELASFYNGNKISGGIQDGPNKGSDASSGCQCFPGWEKEVDATRTNVGAYIDLETDIAERWTTGIAARFENYSDFGSTLTGKLATRYAFTDAFALRGAISTGFRAPSLAQGNYTAIQTVSIGSQLVESGIFPYGDGLGAASALGAEPLKAERSVNLSGGLTYNTGKFAVTIDAYQIDVKNRIVLSEQFSGPALETYLKSQNIFAGAAIYFTNKLETRTSGIDITSRYGINMGKARNLKVILSANFNKNEITNKDKITTPEKIKQFSDTPLLGEVEIARIEKANPNNVVNLIFDYTQKKWNLMLRNVRFGNITWSEYNDIGDIVQQVFSPKIQTDVEVGYKISKELHFALGSNNVLDIYPDKYRKDLAFGGLFQYDGTYPLGFNGRYVYARFAYKM